jgi:hypothetical protein
MSRISSDAILDKLRNRLSRPALPTVPCILGPLKVHHALCDWGVSTNILPKMAYDCLEEVHLPPPRASHAAARFESTDTQARGR